MKPAAIVALVILQAFTAHALTNISTCSDLNVEGETYVLTADIANAAPASGYCMRATANNVTLDCNNHVVDGVDNTGSVGVLLSGKSDVTVKNCNFRDWGRSIRVSSGSGNSITDNTITSSSLDGVYATDGFGLVLERNSSSGNAFDGIVIIGVASAVVEDNNVFSNTVKGFRLSFNSNSVFRGNRAYSNADGFYIDATAGGGNTYHGNRVYSNTGAGVRMGGATSNSFYNNDFNNTTNVLFTGTGSYSWNVSKTAGPNIVGGPFIGGNFWAAPTGTGFSQACPDANFDGFCDAPFNLDAGNSDNLPLAIPPTCDFDGSCEAPLENMVLCPSDCSSLSCGNMTCDSPSENCFTCPGDCLTAPVMDLRMEEGSGTSTADSSGNANNGTFSGALNWTTSTRGSPSTAAVNFDATSELIQVLDSPTLDFATGSFTVSMWGYHRDFSYPKEWFMMGKSASCYSGPTPGWDVEFSHSSLGLNVCIWDGVQRVFTTLPFDAGYQPEDVKLEWNHLVVVFDRNAYRIRAYLNGVRQSSEVNISSVTGSTDNSNNLWIGSKHGWFTDGILDDATIWGRVFSDAEVAALYETGNYCTVCGNSSCTGGETCTTCPEDCGACAPVCGDSTCNGTESCNNCPSDCGACPSTGTAAVPGYSGLELVLTLSFLSLYYASFRSRKGV